MTYITYPFTLDSSGKVETTTTSSKGYLDRIVTLLSTTVGQRPMAQDYGVNWEKALFENEEQMDIAVVQAINLAIATWIPEIEVDSIIVNSSGREGASFVDLRVILPDNSITTMSISTATFNYDGLITR